MSSPRGGNKVYSALMLLAVSVLAGLLSAGLVVPVVALAAGSANTMADNLEALPAELATPAQSQRSRVLLADGTTLATFYDENRQYVPLKKIAKIMREAQVGIEDHRFYEHGAIDLKGTLRALVRNSAGGSTQGGSTLTQQYVKQVRIEAAKAAGDEAGIQKAQESTYQRKFQEMRYALALEKKFTKDEILERYLNIAYYGDGAYGVESAARHYFGVSAKKLNLAQAAMLAGIVQNPTSLDPVNNPKAAIERRNVVLNRLADPTVGVITKEQAESAKKVKFNKKKVKRTLAGCNETRFPHLCEYVRTTLIKTENGLGKTAKEREDKLDRGGLTIQTRIDPKTQKAAEKAIKNFINPRDPVIGTMTIVEPGTGLIVAMAQSRPKRGTKKGETYYNYAVDGSMGGAEGYQAGSTFKAFTVAAALNKGIPPTKTYDAKPTMYFQGQTFKACDGQTFTLSENWKVGNSTGANGVMNMYRGAAMSVNTYFVQLERDAGICASTRMADLAGVKRGDGKKNLTKEFQWIPSFTLGSAEVTPLSMANAYATFAARGKRCDPVLIKSVKDSRGKTLKIPGANCKQVIDKPVADGVNRVLRSVMQSGGTGARAQVYGYTQAGKTGTTDSNKAVWFCGYTPEMSGCAMIAIDKTNKYWKGKRKSLKQMRLPVSGTWLEGSGGGDAGMKIWRPSMQRALQGHPNRGFVQPPSSILVGKQVPVPSCSGMSVYTCKAVLERAGFTVFITSDYSNYPAGTLVGKSANGYAPQYSTITLTQSKGPAPRPKTQKKSDSSDDKKKSDKKSDDKKSDDKKNN